MVLKNCGSNYSVSAIFGCKNRIGGTVGLFGFAVILCYLYFCGASLLHATNHIDVRCQDLHDFYYQVELKFITPGNRLMQMLSNFFSYSYLESKIKEIRTFQKQDKSVGSMNTLRERLDNDIIEIYKKTHNDGFYNAEVSYKVSLVNSKKVLVKLLVDTKEVFTIKTQVHYVGLSKELAKKYKGDLEAAFQKTIASMAEMKKVVTAAVFNLQKNGFFSPRVLEKRVHVDYKHHKAILKLQIDPGKNVKFSSTEIKAFPGIDQQFVKNRIDWHEEEVFDNEKLLKTAEILSSYQIFSSVQIEPMADKTNGNKVPILLTLKEGKKHSIECSLLYSGMRSMNFEKKSQMQKSLKAVITRIAWTNANVFGGAEKLRILLECSPMRSKRIDYAFAVSLLQPDVLCKNNVTEYLISRKQELTNVFFRKNDKISAMFNYSIASGLLVRTGVVFEDISLDGSEVFFRGNRANMKKYKSLQLPMEIVYDTTDNILNPTMGYKITAKFSHIQLMGLAGSMRTCDLSYVHNFALNESKRTIFAFSIASRNIFGKSIDDIPIDKRIYAGGIGSVRGFANQLATEMVFDADGYAQPMGGKSSIEFNAEIRQKITNNIGFVVFFDGAKIFKNNSVDPNLRLENRRLFLAIGVGMMYYTDIGPVRIDLGFPIGRRKNIDSRLQFALNLGPTF
ncbi:MAG: BamA/TamA family outer membrane protein [Holosporaceae bacterium]|jgi:translocation and assembly module TamA|nr:BamA/TamA family outer membrane protein [Holosporaceae bacterium]